MRTIFWNVDTQYDFMRNDETYMGQLPVPDAREIEGNLEKLTRLAEERSIKVVNTADWHTMNDREISLMPDMVNTYNPHCMIGTKGAEYIPATKPRNPYVVSWQEKDFDKREIIERRELVLYKNEFDIFSGSPHSDEILSIIAPERVIVYGVALNVCDNFAVLGLRKRGVEVYAVTDAMKDLPHLKGTSLGTEKVLENWENAGVKFIKTDEVPGLLEE